jgi:sporulation protein YlmC with PRC-barrel domain
LAGGLLSEVREQAMASPGHSLRYLAPARVAIAGVPSDGMTIYAATGRMLGRLRGFVFDPMDQHLRYFVVRASGLRGKTRIVPAVSARVDIERRAIEVPLDEQELWQLRNFTLDEALRA